MNFNSFLKTQTKHINKALENYLPGKKEYPQKLHEAMHYAVLLGGKRIRPLLTLAACQAVGGEIKEVLPAACAIELIHNYSLVHDDLPCMDNDKERRGQPSCHIKFGEETALLVGDALLTLAFQILSLSSRNYRATHFIAEAIGTRGMVGGQAVDIEFKNKEMDLPTIEYINIHKSGALIAASVKVGALLGGGSSLQAERLYQYGKTVGHLFQIVDDILDQEGYAKVIGVSQARQEAQILLTKAKKSIAPFGRRGLVLGKLADYILTREN